MSPLPTGWVTTTLGDVAKWGSGGTPSRSTPSFFTGSIPWVKTGELGPRLILRSEECISTEAIAQSSAKIFPKGSVVVAMYGATIGKTSILGIDASTNQACAVGAPLHGVTTSEYLLHYLSSQKDAFVSAGQGGAQPNISQSLIKQWPVPLAPLREQQRIADKLDTVLGRVDACRDRLARVAPLLKRFRRSVVQAAMSGQLTPEFDSDGWEHVRLEGVTSITSGVGFPPSLQGRGHGDYPFAKVSDISRAVLEQGGQIDTASNWLSTDDLKGLRARPIPRGSTVFAKIGEGLKLNRRALTQVEMLIDNNCMAVSPDAASLHSGYLYLYLKTVDLEPLSIATAVPSVRRGDIAALELALPALDEQAEIVRRVETLFAFADRLEARRA